MLSLKSEAEVVHEVRDKLRAHRMALAWRQDDLARRSGLGIATLRRFERTGRIGFTGFAKLLVTLGLADKFVDSLPIPEIAPRSIDEFLTKPKLRQRAPRKQRG